MSSDAEKYWLDYRSENMAKFESVMNNIKNHERSFWASLMTIQATLLGISMALTTYLNIHANIFLGATWVCLILSIAFGIVVFKWE